MKGDVILINVQHLDKSERTNLPATSPLRIIYIFKFAVLFVQ